MSIDKLNQKLSKFFNSIGNKTLHKTATLGNFTDVKSEDDMEQHAAMIYEMLTLPKYQEIINELKASNGVVNVVTYDEYMPLVELLLVKAFPSYTNDIFNMPTQGSPTQSSTEQYYYPQLDSEKEYFISSRFFARQSIQGDSNSILPARERLENLLMGTKKKITLSYLKNQLHMSDDLIANIYGRKPSDAEVQRYEEMALPAEAGGAPSPDPKVAGMIGITPKGMAMVRYENAIASISNRYDNIIADLNNAIYKHQTNLEKFNSDEDFNNTKKHRDAAIKERMEAIESLDNSPVGRLVDDESIGKKLGRNDDGFVNYNPINNINKLARELLTEISLYMRSIRASLKDPKLNPRSPDNERKVQDSVLTRSTTLQQLLMDIQSTDPALNQIKNEWIKVIGACKTKEDFKRIVNVSAGKFKYLLERYNSIIQKNSKVLILDDFDKSAFCTTNTQDHTVELEPGCRQIFSNFVGINDKNKGKDRSMIERQNAYLKALKEWQKKSEDAKLSGSPVPPEPIPPSDEKTGGRIAIIVSSEKVNGLPASSIIEMNIAPVDKQEAEIIVRHLYREHMGEVKNTVIRKLFNEISEQYPNYYESPEALMEMNKRRTEINRQTEIAGNIDEEHRKKMIRSIISARQKDAINAVEKSIELGKTVSGDLYNEEISYDGEAIVKQLKKEIADKLQAGLQGVTKKEPQIEHERYAYEEGSDWAMQVGTVKNAIESLRMKKGEQMEHLQAIKSIDIALRNPKTTPEQRDKYQKEREWRVETLANLDNIIEDYASTSLPHFYLLYGQPGTGKTVWGDALADLLDYDLYTIDISDQRNMYQGNMEKNARNLINFLKKAQEAVFVMDEIDRQLNPGHESGDSGADQKLIAKLLALFDNENDPLFIKNKVYFIMTTNNREQVTDAIRSRASKAEYEVKAPMTVEAYERILSSSIKKYKPLFPNAPIDSINWQGIAQALVQKKIGFRWLENTIKTALDQDCQWQRSVEMMEKGSLTPEYWKRGLGLPLTFNNLIELASIFDTGTTSPVASLVSRRAEQIKPIMERYMTGGTKFETVQIKNPYTNKIEIKTVIPEEINKIMSGESVTGAPPAQPEEQIEFMREIDPATGRMRTVPRKKKELIQEMQEATGFEGDQPIPATEQEKQRQEQDPKKKKKEDMNKKPSVTKVMEETDAESSTDYLFNYLQKQGLIHDGKLIEAKKKPANKSAKETIENPADKFESKGVYYTGRIMVAPATTDVPPVLRNKQNLKK